VAASHGPDQKGSIEKAHSGITWVRFFLCVKNPREIYVRLYNAFEFQPHYAEEQ